MIYNIKNIQRTLLLILILISTSTCLTVFANEPLYIPKQSNDAIGKYLEYIKENDQPINYHEAKIALRNSHSNSVDKVLNFGIGSRPVWLHLSVFNTSQSLMDQRLSIETSWLDKIEIYFEHEKIVTNRVVGDSYQFSTRQNDSRFFVVPFVFQPGLTDVYIRVESPDPMMLPIYLETQELLQEETNLRGYYYGFVYGFLLALLAYNAALFFSLKHKRYLFYVVYLFSFIILNMSYTGHAYQWFWPESTNWQLNSNPLLMIFYSFAGLMFARNFLDTKNNLPLTHKIISRTTYLVLMIALISSLLNNHVALLNSAFIFMFLFPLTMLYLGIVSFKAGVREANYFLPATFVAMVSAAIITLAVMGYLPYNAWTYHGLEIGMLIEAVLLALALAEQFRVSQRERNKAETLSLIDPLTGIYNRRGFYRTTKALFSTAKRKNRSFSLILFDIDHFKVINDTHGHHQGDQVLRKIASILTYSERQGDVLARWGGEEFVIALPETKLEEGMSLAERLRQSLEGTQLEYDKSKILFTASFGVVSLTPETQSLDELISIADNKLYQAKEFGRNCVKS